MAAPYAVRVYRLGLTKHLRAEVIRDGMVIAWAGISGEGPPGQAVALAREWAASLGYPTPEPPAAAIPHVGPADPLDTDDRRRRGR